MAGGSSPPREELAAWLQEEEKKKKCKAKEVDGGRWWRQEAAEFCRCVAKSNRKSTGRAAKTLLPLPGIPSPSSCLPFQNPSWNVNPVKNAPK